MPRGFYLPASELSVGLFALLDVMILVTPDGAMCLREHIINVAPLGDLQEKQQNWIRTEVILKRLSGRKLGRKGGLERKQNRMTQK